MARLSLILKQYILIIFLKIWNSLWSIKITESGVSPAPTYPPSSYHPSSATNTHAMTLAVGDNEAVKESKKQQICDTLGIKQWIFIDQQQPLHALYQLHQPEMQYLVSMFWMSSMVFFQKHITMTTTRSHSTSFSISVILSYFLTWHCGFKVIQMHLLLYHFGVQWTMLPEQSIWWHG